jgi:hypothetical protein
MALDGGNGDQSDKPPPKPPTPPTSPRNPLHGQYLWLGFPLEPGSYNPQISREYNDPESLELIERIQAAEALIQLSQDTRPVNSSGPYLTITQPSRRRRLLTCAMNHPDWPASHYSIGAEPRGRVIPADIPSNPSSGRSLLSYTAIASAQERVIPKPNTQPTITMTSQAEPWLDPTSSTTHDRSEEASRRKRSRAQYESSNGPSTLRRVHSPDEPAPSGSEIKKMRRGPSRPASISTNTQPVFVEDEASAVQEVLQRQRIDQIEAQRKEDYERTFKKNQCSICLDRPTVHTSTPCGKLSQVRVHPLADKSLLGHVFCNVCINEALKAGEAQGPKKSRCPVCRQPIKRSSLIVLELKLRTKSGN